jgi:hypothetical protein
MRETCQLMLPGGPCGKPAVDFLVEQSEGCEYSERFYLCAEHWDEFRDAEYPEYPDDDLSDDFEDF